MFMRIFMCKSQRAVFCFMNFSYFVLLTLFFKLDIMPSLYRIYLLRIDPHQISIYMLKRYCVVSNYLL